MLFLTGEHGQTIFLNAKDIEIKLHLLCRENPKQKFTIGIDAPSLVEIVRANAKVKTKKQGKTRQITDKAY